MAARKKVKNEPLDHDEDELRFRFVWIPDKQQDDEGGIWWPCLSYADHDELQSVLTNHTVDVKQAIFLLYREYQKTNPAAVAGRHDSDNINILVAYLCGDHPPVVARFVPNPREVMDFYTNVIRMERRFGDNQMWRNAMNAVEEQMTSHSPRVPARNHGGLIRLIAPKSNTDADCSKSSKRNSSKRADDCKGKPYLPKKKQKKSHQRDIKPKVKASNFVGIRTRYKSRLWEEAPFKKYTGMSSIDREEKIILPHFEEMWPILVENFNFFIHQDGPLYCLPGVTVSDPKMLLGRDYFNSPLDLRKYLCAYGLSNAVKNPSDEEWDALEYWIRYSIVVQLRSKTLVPPVVQLSQPQSWRLLHKIGFRYAGGKYVLPGVQMKPKGDTSWTKPVKGKDFFEHMDGDDGYWKFLARFGIESFPVNNLDEMERLKLELFLTSCPALDSFKYIKPEKGDPLFISNRKDANSRASCHNAQSNINVKDSSENSDTMDKTVEKIEVHCSQTSTKIEYEMACESDKAMNVEDEVDEHKCKEKGDSSDNEHGVQGKDPSQKCNGARNESNTGSSPEKQVQYLVYESDAFEAATLAGDNVVEHNLESDPTKEPLSEIPYMIQTRETVPLDAINVQLSNLETVEPIQPNKETTGDKDDQHVPKAVQEIVISQIDSQVQAQEQSNPTRLPYLRNVGNPLDCDNHDKMTEHVKNIDGLESDSGNIIVDSKNEDSREHHVPKGVKKTVLSQIDCHMPVFMANMLGRRSIVEQPGNKVTNLDGKGDNIEVLSEQTQTAMVEVLNAAGLSGRVANDGEKSSIKPMSPVKSGTDDKSLLKDSHKMDGARIMQEPTLQMHHVMEAVTESKLQVNEKITNLPHAAKVVLCVAMEISKVGSYHDSIPIGLLIRMCNEASRQELFEDLAMKHFANLIQRLDDDGLLLSCVRGSSIIEQMVEPYDLYNVRVSIGVQLEEVECALESTLLQNSFFARMKKHVENKHHKLQLNEKITNLSHAAKVVLCIAMEISKVGSYHDSIPIGLLKTMCNEASRQGLFEDLAMAHFADLIQRLDDAGLLLSCIPGSSIIQQMVNKDNLYDVRISIGVQLEEVECVLRSTLLQNSFFARMKKHVENKHHKLQLNEKITILPHAAKVVLCIAMEISKVGSYHDSIPIGLLKTMCNEASRQEVFEDLAMAHFADLIQRLDDDGLLLSCVRGSSIIQQMVNKDNLYDVRVSIGVQLEEVECALESTLLQNSFFARMKKHVENNCRT